MEAQPAWAARTVEERGRILRRMAQLLERDRDAVAAVVSAETGKSPKDAQGETAGAIELGYFVAGEGRRFYGRTMPSAVPNRQAMTLRQPLGVAGLIIAANTPIANVAWKVFPRSAVRERRRPQGVRGRARDGARFRAARRRGGRSARRAQRRPGLGEEAGQPLVEDPRVAVVSFTGSTAVGRHDRARRRRAARQGLSRARRQEPARRLRRRRPRQAATAAALSAFSNAGQRCAAGSRLIVFDAVYDRFRELLVERARRRRSGPTTSTTSAP